MSTLERYYLSSFPFKEEVDNCHLLFQRPNIVLPVVQWVYRSTRRGQTQRYSRGFPLRTHERTLHLDMYWNVRKWALALKSGYSASPLIQPPRWRSLATVCHVKQIIDSASAASTNMERVTTLSSHGPSTWVSSMRLNDSAEFYLINGS